MLYNGVCDDGGRDAVTSQCALGTDCAQCGDRPMVREYVSSSTSYASYKYSFDTTLRTTSATLAAGGAPVTQLLRPNNGLR